MDKAEDAHDKVSSAAEDLWEKVGMVLKKRLDQEKEENDARKEKMKGAMKALVGRMEHEEKVVEGEHGVEAKMEEIQTKLDRLEATIDKDLQLLHYSCAGYSWGLSVPAREVWMLVHQDASRKPS